MHKQLQDQHGTDARPKSWNASAGEDPSNPGLVADGTSVVSCSLGFDVSFGAYQCMAALIGVITVIIRGPNDPGGHRAYSSQSRQTLQNLTLDELQPRAPHT